jgi:hypothetical protein
MEPRSALVPRVAFGAAVGLIATAPAPRADACGGFFCNAPLGDGDQPIAQTAENVLFAMARAPGGAYRLEAHVQIFYTGPADSFSWVVPVDGKPALDVGSNQVFSALLAATQPRFEAAFREEGTCRVIPYPRTPGAGAAGGATGGGSIAASAPTASAPAGASPGVAVSFRGDVGPYDAAVIRSTDPGDPRPLLAWLETNRYFVSPEAARLIAGYVREDKHFVAIRLQNDRSVNEIEPLVMKFEGPGPCIPLKLTAIAAVRDLAINLWVLARHRVVPENFYEIAVNDARINWLTGGGGYADLVRRAADEAGGHAFVTEYAGQSGAARANLVPVEALGLDGVRAARTPPEALARIPFFIPRGTRLLEILRKHIPEPEVLVRMGISETQFYNALAAYWQQYSRQFKPFDAAVFADDLDARFARPLRYVHELFASHATLTRLSTFISPDEMTVDPTFVENETLPPVPLVRRAEATMVCGDERFTRCDAPLRVKLPSGRTLWMRPEPLGFPCYGSARPFAYRPPDVSALPALDVAWRRDRAGEGTRRFDWGATIDAQLAALNRPVIEYAATGRSVIPPAPDGGAEPSSGGALDEDGGGELQGGCSCEVGGARWAGGSPAGAALAWLLSRRAARAFRRRRSEPRGAAPRS